MMWQAWPGIELAKYLGEVAGGNALKSTSVTAQWCLARLKRLEQNRGRFFFHVFSDSLIAREMSRPLSYSSQLSGLTVYLPLLGLRCAVVTHNKSLYVLDIPVYTSFIFPFKSDHISSHFLPDNYRLTGLCAWLVDPLRK